MCAEGREVVNREAVNREAVNREAVNREVVNREVVNREKPAPSLSAEVRRRRTQVGEAEG